MAIGKYEHGAARVFAAEAAASEICHFARVDFDVRDSEHLTQTRVAITVQIPHSDPYAGPILLGAAFAREYCVAAAIGDLCFRVLTIRGKYAKRIQLLVRQLLRIGHETSPVIGDVV